MSCHRTEPRAGLWEGGAGQREGGEACTHPPQ